jgi:hypothetical protein
VLAVLPHELAQAGDLGDPALAERPLEDDRDVVLAGGRRLERAPARHPRPLAEQVDVAGVVHLIDEVRAARAAADLAEHHLAVGLLNHSMWVKPSPMPSAVSTLACRARCRR